MEPAGRRRTDRRPYHRHAPSNRSYRDDENQHADPVADRDEIVAPSLTSQPPGAAESAAGEFPEGRSRPVGC